LGLGILFGVAFFGVILAVVGVVIMFINRGDGSNKALKEKIKRLEKEIKELKKNQA